MYRVTPPFPSHTTECHDEQEAAADAEELRLRREQEEAFLLARATEEARQRAAAEAQALRDAEAGQEGGEAEGGGAGQQGGGLQGGGLPGGGAEGTVQGAEAGRQRGSETLAEAPIVAEGAEGSVEAGMVALLGAAAGAEEKKT